MPSLWTHGAGNETKRSVCAWRKSGFGTKRKCRNASGISEAGGRPAVLSAYRPQPPLTQKRQLRNKFRNRGRDCTKPYYMQSSAFAIHLKYRADIDGLRAVAVIAVVLYPAFPKVVPGGFVGV